MLIQNPHIKMNETEHDYSDLFEHIKKQYKLDLFRYAPASLERRMTRFMNLNHIKDVRSLEYKILDDTAYFDYFIKEITVNTTEMFRDPECWKILRNEVLPSLSDHPNIRIWHAGCSSGEEVFSMAILLEELNLRHKTSIIATDINKEIIADAKEGCYSKKSYELNNANYMESGGRHQLDKYISRKETCYKFNPELISNVKFMKHDLTSGAEFSKFDLILCRNVMIYFNKDLQENVFQLFHKSLFKKGFLLIGKKESMVYYSKFRNFLEHNALEKVYRLV